jgi:hypothetical protein
MQELSPAPLRLSPLQPPPFGRYLGYIENPAIVDWDAAETWRRRWQRKAWFFAGVFSQDWLMGAAIADAGYLGLAFAYYYHRPTGLYFEEKAMRPFAFRRDFIPDLWAPWEFRSGQRNWSVQPMPGASGWHFALSGKRLKFDFRLRHAFPGLTAIAPAEDRPFHSTFKLAAMPLEGELSFDGQPIPLGSATAVVDFTLGYPARRIRWNWACLTGKTEDGKSVGINVVAHFNEGLENALWIDGAVTPLSQVQFHLGRNRRADTWRIDSADEKIDIEFQPEGARAENIRLGLIRSQFVQPFGKFTGTIRQNGRALKVSGFGIVEDHHALW